MGFDKMQRPVLIAASRKGGKIRANNKGFAANPELAKIAGAKGGKTKYENKRKGIIKTKEDTGSDGINLADLLANIDE